MNISEIQHALDVLVYFNSKILSVHRFFQPEQIIMLSFEYGEVKGGFTSHHFNKNKGQIVGLLQRLHDELILLDNYLKKETDIESLLRAFDKRVYRNIREDTRRVVKIVRSLKSLAKEAIEVTRRYIKGQCDKKEIGRVYVGVYEKMEKDLDGIKKIMGRDLYIENLLGNILREMRELWETKIRGKTGWFFHGTSVLFLPSIQVHGLDNKKLPRGIKKAIEHMSKIYEKYRPKRHVDINLDMGSVQPALGFRENAIRKDAAASNLPAFLYEILNRDVLGWEEEERARYLAQLTENERKIAETCFRFGRMLRKKNKMVVLHIVFNSAFLKYMGIPDYFSGFDAFFALCQKNGLIRLPEIYSFRRDDIIFVRLLERLGSPVDVKRVNFSSPNNVEMRFDKPILPSFIYIKVKSVTGAKLIPITSWGPKIEPVIS
ncbi:hypothetical protein HOC01_02310 [archaeon]|jgi:hypothetical protein|nr:hypothetical protein [archaeon]MBT6697848.1 hypothetical protein [archaeon]